MDYQLASSSDIFDTIIARRCRSPSYIFLLMEQKLGVPSFCRLRISASRWAAQRRFQNHTFSDIYDELAIILNLDLEEVRSVMNLELSLERENEIPINLVKRKSRIFSGQLEQSSLSTDHYIIRKKLLAESGRSCTEKILLLIALVIASALMFILLRNQA